MRKYSVRLSSKASDDVDALYRYIAEEIFAPVIADKYVDGIYETIHKLTWLASSLAVSENEYLRRLYGAEVRTIRYKKMTVVYNIIADVVYIRRVMASSLIL